MAAGQSMWHWLRLNVSFHVHCDEGTQCKGVPHKFLIVFGPTMEAYGSAGVCYAVSKTKSLLVLLWDLLTIRKQFRVTPFQSSNLLNEIHVVTHVFYLWHWTLILQRDFYNCRPVIKAKATNLINMMVFWQNVDTITHLEKTAIQKRMFFFMGLLSLSWISLHSVSEKLSLFSRNVISVHDKALKQE